jgi:hypothetical protein
MPPLLLSPKHAAERLDMTKRAFETWARRNGVPAKYLGKRTKRYLAADLDRAVNTIHLREAR